MRDHEPVVVGLLTKDRDPGLEVGRLDVCDQSPLEPRYEPFLEPGNLLGRAIAGKDDLLPRIIEGVERMEELLLGTLLALEELDIVDEQKVHLPVPSAEVDGGSLLDGRDQVVRELFAGDVGDPHGGVGLKHRVPDGVHEVSFSEAHTTVKEKRVVHERRFVGDGVARGGSELVVVTYDEALEHVTLVQGRGGPARFAAPACAAVPSACGVTSTVGIGGAAAGSAQRNVRVRGRPRIC